MTLLQPQLIAQLAETFPDAVAWRNMADGDELTLGEWQRRSNRFARGLQEQGLERGDRVGLLIGNDEPLEWLVSYLAIHKAGGVAVPLLARLGPSSWPNPAGRGGIRRAVQRGRRAGSGSGRDGGLHRARRGGALGRSPRLG